MRRTRVRRARLALCGMGIAVVSGGLVAVADPAGAPTSPHPVAVSRDAPLWGSQPASRPVGRTMARSEPTGIAVPALRLDTGLVGLGLRPDGTMEVPADAGTVGWFTGAPTPGEQGPAVIAAHVDWAGRPGAFANLGTLRPGDEIRIGRADGTAAVFTVNQVARYPKDQFPTDEVYGNLDHAGLRLITCGGAFDRTARSYEDNVIVFASLRG